MKTKIMPVVVVLCMATFSFAAEQGSQKDTFWERLQNKVEKLVPATRAVTTTAVGGVRGAKNDEAADIYWKGKDQLKEMSDEEHQKFNFAIESKLNGDNELALKHFEEFLTQFPESQFRVEGLQAVERIKTEIAVAKTLVKPDITQ